MGDSPVTTLFESGVSCVCCSGLMKKPVEQDPDRVCPGSFRLPCRDVQSKILSTESKRTYRTWLSNEIDQATSRWH